MNTQRIQLSENFYLDEFTRSQEAARLGRVVMVAPESPVFYALGYLCVEILQPTRDTLGPGHISSGFRPHWLNTLIGSSKRSQHPKGEAADFTVSGHSPYEVCAWIADSPLPFDQLIYEFGQWVHVSCAIGREPRRQVLTAYYDPRQDKTIYVPGLHTMEELAA